MKVAWPAVRMLARHELRSRWRSVVALGIAAGVFFAGALATTAVLLRADSAYDRMVSATDLADARVGTYNIFNDVAREPDVLQQLAIDRGSILARTDVVASQQLTAVYARRDTSNVEYAGIWAPRHQWDGLDTPVVVDGRLPSTDAVDEVMVNEQRARSLGVQVGSRLGVGIYRSGQVRDFSNGLGTPRAGSLQLTVVGLYRVADAGTGFNGIMAGPAFASQYDASAAIGEILLLKLDRSKESPVFGTVQQQAIRLDQQMAQRFGTGFYNYVDYVEPRQEPDPAISPTEDVLRTGLTLLAIVIAIAGLVLTLQLAGRWSSVGRADDDVERALGMRTNEQVIARLFAALPAIVIASVLGAAGALVGGFLEPPGALNRFEPHPGWLGQPFVAVVGALAVLVLLAGAVALTRSAVLRLGSVVVGDQSRRRASGPVGMALPVPLRFAVTLAATRGSRSRSVRSRLTVAGLAGSMAMLVLVVLLGGQLTRLQQQPLKWGWGADFGISGDSWQLDESLAHDGRVRDADKVIDAPVHLVHRGAIVRVTGYGWTRVKGALAYDMVSGRMPRNPDEVVVGPRVAEQYGAGVGDDIDLADSSGQLYRKHVSGIAVVPTLENEPLGQNILMTGEALGEVSLSTGYSNLLVHARDGAASTALQNLLSQSLEIETRSAPNAIVALGKLSTPTRVLVIVLLISAILLVAEHLALLLRRRGTQLAIGAAIGMSRRQLVLATSSATVLLAVLGLLFGVPLGWAVSRVVIVEIGPRLGLGLASPGILSVSLVALAGFAVACVLAFAMSATVLQRRSLVDLRGFDTGT